MFDSRTARWRGYLWAVLVIAVATGALDLLRDVLSTSTVTLLYLLAICLVAALWGLVPSLLAAFSAFLALNYFFVQPLYTFGVHHPQDVLVLAVFLIVAVIITELVGRARSSLAEAQAREREAVHLYELSTALAGLRTAEPIARILAERLQEVLQARQVEVLIQPGPQGAVTAAGAPGPVGSAGTRSEQLAPLLTARGLLGEIRVWPAGGTWEPVEDRLLRTFASQGALAVERAVLAEAEMRTHVLEESDRLKSALLNSVSHELRTPLATIKAASTSLRSGAVPLDSPASADLLAAIDEESDHLNRLVGNLLDMSRIESGALKPQRQWNLLADIVEETLTRMRRATERYHIENDIPEDLSLVPVDAVQMGQVFTNLIDNSLKYAPAGTAIRIAARQAGDATLEITVSNEGPPVPQEDLEHIFDKFHRVTAADRVTGTGLGLSICKGIVEAHGGRIWAENLPGGFAFHFSLPLTWDGNPPPQLPKEDESA